jgi:hypothetical protein
MPKSLYIEDLLLEFYNQDILFDLVMEDQDRSACLSFVNQIIDNRAFTEKQAKYLVRILTKYRTIAELKGLDFGSLLETPQWKQPFRVIDNTKSITIEQDDKKCLWFVIKMPYALKEKFDTLISKSGSLSNSFWDHERQVRKVKFYSCNIIQLDEFADEHGFFRDDVFYSALANVEQIWQDQETATLCSRIENNEVTLINAPEDAVNYWNQHKNGDIDHDKFLAKSMGYPVAANTVSSTPFEKIVSTASTNFWHTDLATVFDLYKKVQGKIAVIVNKDRESCQWVKMFTRFAEEVVVNSDIKICFRTDKNDPDQSFNQWVKDNGYGGSVEDGKIYIFQSKPPKWLFSGDHDIKIIITNSLYPIPSSITQDWMASHPCVLYVGDQKASKIKDKNIVNL